MVKRGGFTLEIINAETNEPFKEHTCPTTGKTYVEVEPDAEYFMQLSHDRNAMLIGRCAIDGENLGYQISLFAKGPHKGGLWRQVGGKTTMTALKFSKTSSLQQNSAERTRPLPWTGIILEIINAETKEPFKEHTCPTTGKTYVEVEPDAEYFLQLSQDRKPMLLGMYAIDGEHLGYQISLFAEGPHILCGLLRLCGGKTNMTALKFSKTSSLHQNSAEQTRPLPWTGIIKASYFEAINPTLKHRRRDHTSTWSGGNVGCTRGDGSGLVGKKGVKSQSGNIIDVKKLPASNTYVKHRPGGKKGVKSQSGNIIDVKKLPASNTYVKHRPGMRLQTIEVQYCTAPGLIQAGILPKPPMWDCRQKSFSRKRSAPEIPIVTPQKIKREASVIDGHTVMQAKEYDLFDLSCTPDSDSDGENDCVIFTATQRIKREASVIDGHTVMQAKEYELFDLSGTPDSDLKEKTDCVIFTATTNYDKIKAGGG
eukprot:CAMPEP_0198303834 /NCGR_PEP_ID=MMETSP1449-20131203/57089_1 /TAXON_ID=420275 /ORGANISM="Attheya septentrionalis, Strain CCMP2084" /LENGTH=480 /DNA_ID=CAMNT_0044006341 /DNA_START=27 /DNA_END=1472 /DNA_ORIENTATION=+